MKHRINKGSLKTWKDDRGFGFIKPARGGQEVFLHISALKGATRRPRVGDTILYEQVTQPDGKVRAAKASIQGVATRVFSTKKKSSKRGGLETLVSLVILTVTAVFLAIEFSHLLPSITSTTKTECKIKGNISHNTNKKLYHLPGMQDYESTRIDPRRGERWFCTESEAIENGWRKAPN